MTSSNKTYISNIYETHWKENENYCIAYQMTIVIHVRLISLFRALGVDLALSDIWMM